MSRNQAELLCSATFADPTKGARYVWPRLLSGLSGIKSTTSLPDPAFASLPSRVAGIVPHGLSEDGGWSPRDHLSKSDERNMALFSQYAVAAAEEALKDADILQSLSESEKEATGVVIGSGIGNLEDQHKTSVAFDKYGHHKTHPLFVPRLLINMAAGHVAMRHGFKGPSLAPTTACTTGLHAIIEGTQLIRQLGIGAKGMEDTVDVVVAGASEACIHPVAISGFARARSLSTSFNDEPEKASRPFDQQRDGFVIGEGAGVVVLEERERAMRRGAPIYGEIVGTGMSCDASHMTAPSEDGRGAQLAMERALHSLGGISVSEDSLRNIEDSWTWPAREVAYVNAHATGTSVGDSVENRAIKNVCERLQVLPRKVMVTSTKGATGHLLGAAGAVEAIFTLLSIRHGGIPPTLNLESPGPATGNGASEGCVDNVGAGVDWDLDYVTERRDYKPRLALTNSFGFGGTNASICLRDAADSKA